MMFLVLSCFTLAYAFINPLVPSGPRDRPNLLNDENIFVLKALDAINQYYVKQGNNVPRTLVKVSSATSQAVAGTIYRFILEVTQGSKVESCAVEILSKRWISGDEGLVPSDPDCSPVKDTIEERGLKIGGESPADVNDPEVQKALAFAEQSYNDMTNNANLVKVVSVSKVTKQLVSGALYHFYGVKFGTTFCSKYTTDTKGCVVNESGPTQTCEFKVLNQPWVAPGLTLNLIGC